MGRSFKVMNAAIPCLLLLIINIQMVASSEEAKKQPHIITFIADDWGWYQESIINNYN